MSIKLPIKTEYEIFEHKGRKFMRTRDLASILKVKQQYELTRNIKDEFGDDEVILKGKKTRDFRNDNVDCDRTTFIEVCDVILFLSAGVIKHRIDLERKKYLLTYLTNLV